MEQNSDLSQPDILLRIEAGKNDDDAGQPASNSTKQALRFQKIEKKRAERKNQLLIDLAKAKEAGADLSAVAIQVSGNPYRPLYTLARSLFSGKYFWHDALEAAGLPADEITRKRHWDKDLIKAKLMARHQEKKPLNSDSVRDDDYALYVAAKAKRHFGSYDKALIYSGFDPKKVRVHKKAFTRQEIVRKIIDLHIHGRPLDHTHMKRGRYRRYYYSVKGQFTGGWREAVETAGIDYVQCCQKKPNGWWTKERVIEQIKQLLLDGQPVNSGFVSDVRNDLYLAGSRRFTGGWNEALRASGVDPEKVRLRKAPLSKPQLIAAIKALSEQDQDLSVQVMSLGGNKYLRQIYEMATNRFGSWRQAIIEAGLAYDQIRKHRASLSPKELADIVRKLEAAGLSLRAVDFQRSDEYCWIYSMVIHRFDSWKEFLDFAGIDSGKWCAITDWKNGQGVIDYLRANYDSGIVTAGATKDTIFSQAVRCYYAGLEEAVAAAGMIYTRSGIVSREQLDNEKVIGVLYACNLKFLQQLADNIYYSARGGRRRSLEQSDLVNEAFTKMLELLPDKPADQGLREFCRQPILTALRKLNQEMFRETVYGEETYLDIFSTDEDVWL